MRKLSKKKLEEWVLGMSHEMGDITIEQFAYLESQMPAVAYVNSKGEVKCMDCGHTFTAESCGIDGTIECPVCHRRLKVQWTNKKMYRNRYFTNISQAWGDHWQVVRYFWATHFVTKTGKVSKQAFEVMQVWISDEGKVVYLANNLLMYPNYSVCPFSLMSGLHVKHPESVGFYRSFDIRSIRCDTQKVFSVSKFLTYYGIKKNVNRQNGGFYLDFLFKFIQEPLVEVMYKSKKYDLLWKLHEKDFYKHDERYAERIAALKVALRHHYFDNKEFASSKKSKRETMYSDWIDLVDNVLDLELDNRSPHYICPDNLSDMHHVLLNRVRRKREEEQQEKNKDNILRDMMIEQKYDDERKPFFDMLFDEGGIKIKVLPNIKAFYDEGKEMHHCVFANKYYDVEKKPDCLILSARKGDDWNNPDEVVETVEISLTDYTIKQSRGHYNQNSKYHNKIMSIVLNHMDEIQAIDEKRKKSRNKKLIA